MSNENFKEVKTQFEFDRGRGIYLTLMEICSYNGQSGELLKFLIYAGLLKKCSQ